MLRAVAAIVLISFVATAAPAAWACSSIAEDDARCCCDRGDSCDAPEHPRIEATCCCEIRESAPAERIAQPIQHSTIRELLDRVDTLAHEAEPAPPAPRAITRRLATAHAPPAPTLLRLHTCLRC